MAPSLPHHGRRGADFAARHFLLDIDASGIATVTLNRPERKNPLTFDSYAELTAFFTHLRHVEDVRVVIVTGAGGNFSSGGDVHDIIAPLLDMKMPELLQFTRMTGDLVLAMRHCPQPVISAIDGVCAGAGAMMALASDMRVASDTARCAFLFTRVGLGGCDMGACTLLPRLIGQGRASELLFTGRSFDAAEGLASGFYNRVVASDAQEAAKTLATSLALGPTFGHAMTKTMLHQEWSMTIEQAIEAEAQAQAICMQTQDFRRAYDAFAAKRAPEFKGD